MTHEAHACRQPERTRADVRAPRCAALAPDRDVPLRKPESDPRGSLEQKIEALLARQTADGHDERLPVRRWNVQLTQTVRNDT